jgi:hypothetical protein
MHLRRKGPGESLLRIGRVLAIARYEQRSHMAGRQALRLVGVAMSLLLPVAVLSGPPLKSLLLGTTGAAEEVPKENGWGAGPPPPAMVKVKGVLPAELETRMVLAEDSPFTIERLQPVTLRAPYVTGEVRAALDTIDGDEKLEVRTYFFTYQLPGRSLLIAVLAVSLLTGPLADALPGERARRTLEVLLTTGITRGELIGGKWLAWTLSSTATALIASGVAIWRGIQEPGWWLLGLPLFIGSAVAFGLWLVRLVDDVVGGSAAPMRVLPVAAGATALLAHGVSNLNPVAGAAVPLGGALLVAGNVFQSGAQIVAATAGTALFIGAVLTRTGRDLDRVDTTSSPTRWGAVGLSGVAILLWWLSVAGPRVWGSGITTDLVTPMPRSMMGGALALLACAFVAIAREMRAGRVTVARVSSPAVSVAVTLAVSAALAASGSLPALDLSSGRETIDAMAARLREGAVPFALFDSGEAMLAAMLSVLGQVVLFRGIVATRAGWIVASMLWCFAVCPLGPWAALAASLALGALAADHGVLAALAAQAIWTLAASAGVSWGEGWAAAPAALGFQMMALAIALGASRLLRREPMRHQS